MYQEIIERVNRSVARIGIPGANGNTPSIERTERESDLPPSRVAVKQLGEAMKMVPPSDGTDRLIDAMLDELRAITVCLREITASLACIKTALDSLNNRWFYLILALITALCAIVGYKVAFPIGP